LAAPAGALPNALKVERLRAVDCKSRETGFTYEKVEPAELKKLAPPAPAPALEPEPSYGAVISPKKRRVVMMMMCLLY